MTRIAAILITCAALIAAHAHAAGTEIIDLKHRPASEVLPLIQPFLAAGDAATGHGFQLIVRASPATVKEIRAIVVAVDRAPKRLLISVRQIDAREAQRRSVEASGTIRGARVEVQTDAAPAPDARVRVMSTRTDAEDAGMQRVQVLEGHSASIRLGQSVPVVTRAGSFDGSRMQGAQAEFAYRDVDTGFDVLPRVNDDQVILEIRPYRARIADASGTVATQHMHSTVTGTLGEWFEIGAVVHSDRDDASGYVFTTRRSDAAQTATLVKVDVLPE